jgi:hypothetical protein
MMYHQSERLCKTRRRSLAILAALVLVVSAVSGAGAAPAQQGGEDAGPPAESAPAQFELAPVFPYEDSEASYTPGYLHLATGDLSTLELIPQYAWPYALQSIGHTMASYQNYGSSPYFHHGIDGIVNAGNPVYATSGGQVVNVENYQPGNDLYWEVAILDPEGFVWQFHHIEVSSIPQSIWDKYYEYLADPVNGGFVAAGTTIGAVVYWPVVTFGERFNHIHLNILDGGGNYVNGFAFLEPLADTQVPEIQAIGLVQGGQILPGNQVAGGYSLYARTRDLILHQAFYVPPYEITVSVDGGPAETVWRFDNLPGGGDRYAYVSAFFIPPTCGNYTCRDFYIDLGFIPGGRRVFPSSGGSHSALVTVRDYAGNTASQTFTWTIPAPPAGAVVFFDGFEGTRAPDAVWTRNPSGTDTATSGRWETGNPEATNSSGPKQLDLTVSGDNALVTGAAAGASASSNDVDGGRTSMRSPDIALPNVADLTLSFYSYLAHTASNTSDYLRVTVVGPLAPDGAPQGRAPADTVVWQEPGANVDRDAVWAYHQADISAYAGQTIYLLVEAADGGGATTVVEAAVDDVQIATTSPLAVTLADFTARAGRGHVRLAWETASEIDNLGFNLYRSERVASPEALLAFVPSQAPGSSVGAAYEWVDFKVTPGVTYWYWLEDVDVYGVTTLHGPVRVDY